MEPVSRQRVGFVPAAYYEHPEVGALDLAVLTVLATFANRASVCWPSQSTIAAAVKLDRSTVNRILAKLVALGLIELSKHPNPAIRCHIYRLIGHGAAVTAFLAGRDEPVSDTADCHNTPSDRAPPASVADDHTEQPEHSSNTSLSKTRKDAGESECECEIDRDRTSPPSLSVVGPDWAPSPADLAFARSHRPDLGANAITLIATKFALHYRGRRLSDPSALFCRWILTERTSCHDNRRFARHPTAVRPSSGRDEGKRSSRKAKHSASLAERNRAAADECYHRIMARRGEPLSA